MGSHARVRCWLLVALASGCPQAPRERTPCAPGQAAALEVRDGAGALQLALKDAGKPGLFDLCDAAGKRVGGVDKDPSTLTLTDGKGALVLKLHADSASDASGLGPKAARLRIHSEHDEHRVLKPDGVPFGSVTKSDAGATAFNPASQPIATIEKRGKDQILLGTDGATRMFVVPAASATAAGAFALEGLSLEERLLIYVYWSRNTDKR